MAKAIIENIIRTQRGIIASENNFIRTMRGKDGSGYPFLSDKELGMLWLVYCEEVAKRG